MASRTLLVIPHVFRETQTMEHVTTRLRFCPMPPDLGLVANVAHEVVRSHRHVPVFALDSHHDASALTAAAHVGYYLAMASAHGANAVRF